MEALEKSEFNREGEAKLQSSVFLFPSLPETNKGKKAEVKFCFCLFLFLFYIPECRQ